MALTFQKICQGELLWVALGNFMNDWFDSAGDRRIELITSPLSLPEPPSEEMLRWAIFCAASVEYLCRRSDVACPLWVNDLQYTTLPEPWFDVPMAYKPSVQAFLREQTPEPFAKRNIYCGNRVFANKYDCTKQYSRLSAPVEHSPEY